MTFLRAAAHLALAALLAFACFARAQQPVPALSARVTDLTATLTPAQANALEQKLAQFESRKGVQIAVLVVPTTEPEDIAQYAIRVAEKWKLGRKGVDDGAILLVAKDDRKLRIEVGRGLEGALTDADSKRIISEVIVPLLKHGDFAGGIDAGVDRMIKIADGEPLPEPQRQSYSGGGWGEFLPIAIILALVAGGVLRAIFGRFLGSAATGGMTGFVTWLVLGLTGVALVAGILAFIFNLLAGAIVSPTGWSNRGRTGGMGGYGHWGGWGGGGGGWSGGGGGGGGWSGGGGDFGGGGASGEW